MLTDTAALAASAILILGYYLLLFCRYRQAAGISIHAFNDGIRKRWLVKIIQHDGLTITAVQTLRNSLMAANFMASTAILLIIGALNLSDKIADNSRWIIAALHQSSQYLPALKLGLLVITFFIAFFCFSMAIRFFNHVGYMIGLSAGNDEKEHLFQITLLYLNNAGRFYSYGNRAFYFSLPFILWFFGPYFLIAGTVMLLVGLALLDHAPCSLRN